MAKTAKHGSSLARVRRAVMPLLLVALVAALAVPAAAARPAEVIVLPGASSAEGIAAGRGATFWARATDSSRRRGRARAHSIRRLRLPSL
jgi:hypothetical protein